MPVRGLRSSSAPSVLKVASRALARAKVHWGKLDAEKLGKDGPPKGKAHRYPEKYYEGVMKGARLVAKECTKNRISE